MNLSKSQVVKFSTACLFSSLCILAFSFFTLKPKFTEPINKKTTIESEAISWNEAQSMKNRFVELQPLKIELSNPNDPSRNNIVPLEGFRIKASQLLEIINNNKSGNGMIADNVIFYFGAEEPQPNFVTPEYRIIAVGEKDGSLMIPLSDEDKADKGSSSIFDKAEPCPPMCSK